MLDKAMQVFKNEAQKHIDALQANPYILRLEFVTIEDAEKEANAYLKEQELKSLNFIETKLGGVMGEYFRLTNGKLRDDDVN